jgi:very-short-patch-repair endonuclease
MAGDWPFLGSEARAAGAANRYQLRTHYEQVHRDVYVPRGAELTPIDKAVAAWLWSGRRGVAAGLSAAALHGSRWIGDHEPAELNQASLHGDAGVVLHSDRLAEEEICLVRGIRATTPARTAFDLGRRKGQTLAVIRVDALFQATQLKLPDVQALIDTHSGARGLVQLRRVLELADYGAESPQETRTRLLLTSAGIRPTHTQIEVFDGRYLVGRIDMGWLEWKVGVQYDGIQHWQDPRQRTRDIDQDVEYRDLGWRMVRVGANLLKYRGPTVIARARDALRAAGAPH